MLTISNLSKAYRGQRILDGVNWFAPDRTRIGLTGMNGAGKSTLLKLIAGQIEPDGGEINLPKGTTVGYLPQEVIGASGRTVFDEAMGAFADLHALEAECRRLEEALGAAPVEGAAHDLLMAAYHDVRERFDGQVRYDLEAETERVLVGLGFRTADFTRDLGTFSGGWQMRVALAKLLLCRPRVLLLDEPTNHLDLEARTWLEEFLAASESLVILVAHDRYFLDVCVQRITEVSRGRLTDYDCNYTAYLAQREERHAQEAEAYGAQQEEIARIEAFVRRFRYQASKAALVQSRIKQLEKMERLTPPDGHERRVKIRLPDPPRSGRIVVGLEQATKRYGDLTVYEGVDLLIERGSKVALVGPNGAGKSTLLKLLVGVEPLTAGRRVCGHNVRLAYFAQDQSAALDAEKSVLEELTAVTPTELMPRVRDLLGAFLFSGDAVEKPVRVLSGGERNRLALAKLLIEPANCLLLDEPTNHLDLTAKEVLLEALLEYEGTVVLVAHDRYILDRLPSQVIEVGHGGALRYLGNYEDYRAKKAAMETGSTSSVGARTGSNGAHENGMRVPSRGAADERGNGAEDAARARVDRDVVRRRARAEEKRRREAEDLESTIAAKETELAELTQVMNDPDFYQTHPEPQRLFSSYARLKREVEALYERLERLSA
ncbi:MAG: ABC-F family ATP-binding cassette domain-containing protein [Deltaproteobacteria bacterium]|nr:ABC-F family ATP-binding cassette domain-containing protein [Deltaproteobacteria bacterium]